MTESKQSKEDEQKSVKKNGLGDCRVKQSNVHNQHQWKQRNKANENKNKNESSKQTVENSDRDDKASSMCSVSEHEENKEIYQLISHIQKFPEDQHAQEKIVLQYEWLVHSLAGKYSRNKGNHEDLVQVGMIGLLIAVKRFNESYGKSFEAFAIPTIIGEIKRFIRDKTWGVHVPRRIKELGPKINRAVDELTNTLQKSPSVKDISVHLQVSEEEVLETMEMTKSYRALSIDYTHETNADSSSFTLLDLVGVKEDNYEKVDTHLVLESIFPALPEREQEILKLTFFENLSQQEVGELLGLSQMHVSRLQRRSLRKLREILGSDNFYIFD